MNATDKAALLQQLFAVNNDASAGINYLRISIGASDLNSSVFSYDDMPAGQLRALRTRLGIEALERVLPDTPTR